MTRESEWDDASRGRAMRLREYERSIDRETGLPIEDAFTNQPFIVHNDAVNYAARAIAKEREKDGAQHDDKWMAHRTYYVRTVDTDALPAPDERTPQ